jgi:hypothetical protein
MRNHARKVTWLDRLDWRFVSWCLFWLLVIALFVILNLVAYIGAMP